MYTVRVEDEMEFVNEIPCESIDRVLEVVREWLLTSESGETPIYSIEITPQSVRLFHLVVVVNSDLVHNSLIESRKGLNYDYYCYHLRRNQLHR